MAERHFPPPAPRPGAAAEDAERSSPATESDSQASARTNRDRKSGFRLPAGRAGERKKPRAQGTDRFPQDGAGREEHQALQPGIKPVHELLEREPAKVDCVFVLKGRHGRDTDTVLTLCRSVGVLFKLVDGAFLDRLWPGRHQGVIARLVSSGFSDLDTVLAESSAAPLPLILALDQVQDPGNAGALARTLYALGGGGLIVPRHNGVYLGGAAAKASAGALERLPVTKVPNLGQALDRAVEAGFTLYGTTSSSRAACGPSTRTAAPADVFSLQPALPAVVILGGEEGGLRPSIAGRCMAHIHIPLARDFDSLNVAQAGAIILARFAAACRPR